MFDALFVAGGALWFLTYGLLIRVQARDRTFGMPLVAVGVNLAWEFTYAAIHPYPHGLQPVIVVWVLLDLVIVYQTLRYAPAAFPDLPWAAVYGTLALSAAIGLPLVLTIGDAFGDAWGVHAAYLDNLMFSALYLAMLHGRRSTRGQSLGIAVTKLAGTGLISLAFAFFPPMFAGSPLLLTLFLACLLLDMAYLVAYCRMRATERALAAGRVELLPRSREVVPG
jgi:hypothetical protein